MAKAKEIEGLNCETEALSAIRLVLRTRLGEMCDLRAAALEWGDIEGVHDMRVASRRLRSAIKDFGDVLGKKSLPRRRLKKVADALGDVRDQDVAIAALEKLRGELRGELRAEAGEEVSVGIGRLVDERASRRGAARVKLAFVIADAPLAELAGKFLSRLERAGDDAADGKGGNRGRGAARASSFRQAGRQVIAARVAELQDLSNSLHHPLDIEPLHNMRIAAKRLRYAVELFAPCWDGQLAPYAHEVSELQSSLGELRDCDIWNADLGARLDRNRADPARRRTYGGGALEGQQIRRAAVWLLDHFTKERSKHFRHALARWEEWETDGFFARLESVLDNAPLTTGADAVATQAVYVVHAVAPANEPGSAPPLPDAPDSPVKT